MYNPLLPSVVETDLFLPFPHHQKYIHVYLSKLLKLKIVQLEKKICNLFCLLFAIMGALAPISLHLSFG